MRRFSLALLVLSLAGLGACDSAPGPARANAEPFWDPSTPVYLESKAFPVYTGSFDWNFHIEDRDQIGEAPFSFRTFAVSEERQAIETSRITMTPQADSTYTFTGAWPGFSHPNAKVYAVVLDSTQNEGLRAVGPFNALDEGPQKTATPAKSYHVMGGTIIIDYIDADDGLLPAPTSVFIPTAGPGGDTIDDVAYLVYVPKGRREVADADALVQVWGPRGASVVTESIGYDELPRFVLGLVPSGT